MKMLALISRFVAVPFDELFDGYFSLSPQQVCLFGVQFIAWMISIAGLLWDGHIVR